MVGRNRSGELAEFCRDASCVPLLTKEQEHRIAKRMHDGLPRMQARCRELLITANMRLVFSIAKRFQGRGLDLADLVQEGMFGLMRAVKDYDPDRTRFSTYASYWIKQHIVRAIVDKGRLVRVPNYQRRLALLWSKVEQSLHTNDYAQPNENDIIAGVVRLTSANQYMHGSHMNVIRAGVQALRASVLPLNNQADEGNILRHLQSRKSALDLPVDNEVMENALASLDCLELLEAQILRMHYGLNEQPAMTYSAIGKRLGVSRQRVQQKSQTALKKLRKILVGEEAA